MPQAVLPPSPPGTDPRICDLIEAVQRQHYKIGTCAPAGGPKSFRRENRPRDASGAGATATSTRSRPMRSATGAWRAEQSATRS